MTHDDIIVGHTYEAKKPQRVGWMRFLNDRQVVFCGNGIVQYDSPSVGLGRHYPKTTMEKFLKWAGKDVTNQMPKGDWRK